jgi:hypothetical protein
VEAAAGTSSVYLAADPCDEPIGYFAAFTTILRFTADPKSTPLRSISYHITALCQYQYYYWSGGEEESTSQSC